MTSITEALDAVQRLLAILGPRWTDRAELSLVIGDNFADITIVRTSGNLDERMQLVDRAVVHLEAQAHPWRPTPDAPATFWGIYGGVGDLNGFSIQVSTPIWHSEMEMAGVA